jgi:molybdate transport system substrate-binding protein
MALMPLPSELSSHRHPVQPRAAVLSFLLVISPLAAMAPACTSSADDVVLVLAAASTIDAIESAVDDFRGGTAARIEVSFAATSVLARQIEEGAPADLMLSASAAWADYVEDRAIVDRRVALVGNQLTVIVPADSDVHAQPLAQIASDDRLQRIAIADPASVPAGIYATEALKNAGLWPALEPRLVPTLDARAALTLVAGGETSAGLVYATDAAATPRVRVIAQVDPQLHQPIEYPLLLLGGARPEAVLFYEYLISERGRAHFYDRGFRQAGR